jgi:hypothetical protein
VFQRCFQVLGTTTILDFYHAAQHMYKLVLPPGWMGGHAPASSGLPRYVTRCAAVNGAQVRHKIFLGKSHIS